MMLPLCFGFPPPRISDKFLRLREKFSQFHLLPKNFSIFPISLHFPLFRPTLLFPPTFTNFLPVFGNGILHTLGLCVFLSPTLTMMHLCITQCMYWTPLVLRM